MSWLMFMSRCAACPFLVRMSYCFGLYGVLECMQRQYSDRVEATKVESVLLPSPFLLGGSWDLVSTVISTLTAVKNQL